MRPRDVIESSVQGGLAMHTIVDRQELTKRDLISLTIEVPQIARKIRPGSSSSCG